MTDQTALDPKRPWINDPRDLGENTNLLATLFNPAGRSRKLAFTKAWTILFFVQLITLIGLNMLAGVMGLAGGSPSLISGPAAYIIPILFLICGLIVYVPHARRLNDSGKSSFWGLIALIPVIVASGFMFQTLVTHSASYHERAIERNAYLSDPEGFEAKKRAEAAEARAKAEAEEKASEDASEGSSRDARRAARGGRQGARGGRGGRGRGGGGWSGGTPEYKQDLPSWNDAVLKPALGGVPGIMIGLNFLVMFWSLFWVARKPSTDEASVADTISDQRQPYQA